EQTFAAFEQANPDIAVEVDGKPSTDIIAGLIANGTASGVDVVTTQYRASSLVQGNVLADLSAQWNATGYFAIGAKYPTSIVMTAALISAIPVIVFYVLFNRLVVD